jgi:sulfofructose kinase
VEDAVWDAVGLGAAPRDITVRLDPFPAADQKVAARDFAETGGGPVPTALVTLARLGRRCLFGGVVGDDDAGRLIRDGLQQEGVRTDALIVRPGLTSPASVILVEPDGRRRVAECGQSALPYGEDDAALLLADIDRCRALLVDARLPVPQLAAARRAREAGALVMLDCGHPRPGVEDLLAQCDIAIVSHSYPRRLHGGSYDARDFLTGLQARLAASGRRIAGLTRGDRGCLLLTGAGALVDLPAVNVEVVDTTGAGDVFHGAFLHEILSGSDPADAARFANAAAGLSCRALTGRAPLPPIDQIRAAAR